MTSPASEDERRHRARLANMHQELLAPASAIVGYTEMLRDEAVRLDLRGAIPDLERILTAARALYQLVDRLLSIGGRPGQGADASLMIARAELRHEVRTPVNAIKGYTELLLEVIDDVDGGALRPDLERLLAEVASLLAKSDSIDLSDRNDEAGLGTDATGRMVTDLVRAIRPLEPDTTRSPEVGKILVVDDNESNRDLLLRRLTRDGHRVVVAQSGRAALEILAAEDFDLMLLDLMMPNMNGFELLRRLKTDDRMREVAVIMISGLQEMDSLVRCIEGGAEDYLPKPIDPTLLRARIDACLKRKQWRARERYYLAQLELERKKTETLLHNILPAPIVTRLKGGEAEIADRYGDVTILFCDLVDSTRLAASITPAKLVNYLNRIFSEFDILVRVLQIEKIKTTGDGYMAAAGLPEPRPDHAEVMAELALGMLEAVERINHVEASRFRIRIGIHSGSVVAGIIGTHRSIYDVWGDTVNLANHLEKHGLPGRIHVSNEVRQALENRYEFESRGLIDIKGKGKMETFFLNKR
jgi:adenylate cyclase